MRAESYNNNVLFALDEIRKSLANIKQQIQQIEGAVMILDTARFQAVTEGVSANEPKK